MKTASRLLAIAAILAGASVALAADDAFVDTGDDLFEETSVDGAPPQAAPPAADSATMDDLFGKQGAAPAPVDAPVAPPQDAGASSGSPTLSEELKAIQENDRSQKKAKASAVSAPSKQTRSSKANKKASPSSASGRGFFKVTREACPMMVEPSEGSTVTGRTGASRKIWVEDVDASWVRAFNKAGEAVYVSKDCLN